MVYHLLYTVNMGIYYLICYLLDLTIKMASVGVKLKHFTLKSEQIALCK